MELFKCPGSQMIGQPVPEYIECPFCKGEVEIWSDESKATCASCKNTVRREMKAGCWEWCESAKECLGEDLLRKVQAEKGKL